MKLFLLVSAIALPLQAVTLSSPGATFSQSGFPASKTADAVVAANNGWAVAPQGGTAQRIWWNVTGVGSSTTIRRFDFELNFRGTTGSFQKFNLRRFTLAYTTDAVVSNSSNWILMTPVSATTSTPALGDLSINGATGEISLTGGTGDVSMDYFVTADTGSGAAITGFSLRAIPVSGNLGTAAGGNFVLGEVSVTVPPALIIVPEDITLNEDSPMTTLSILRAGNTASAVTVTGTVSGTATFIDDYTRSFGSPHLHTFIPGSTEIPIWLDPVDDADNENAETVIITWANSPSYTLSHPTTTITIGDTDGSGYDDYVAGHGLVGNDALEDADPNGDGISNIGAYAFRLNPAGPFPRAWRERLPRFSVRSGGRNDFPAITWKLPQPWPADVRFIVTESETLSSPWTEVARRTGYGVGSLWTGSSSPSIDDSGSPLKTVVVPGSENMGARPKAFLRLELQKSSLGGGGGSN